jgi:hypothetical protein
VSDAHELNVRHTVIRPPHNLAPAPVVANRSNQSLNAQLTREPSKISDIPDNRIADTEGSLGDDSAIRPTTWCSAVRSIMSMITHACPDATHEQNSHDVPFCWKPQPLKSACINTDYRSSRVLPPRRYFTRC